MPVQFEIRILPRHFKRGKLLVSGRRSRFFGCQLDVTPDITLELESDVLYLPFLVYDEVLVPFDLLAQIGNPGQ